MLSGKYVFLSGPITGQPNYNRELFGKAEQLAYSHGAIQVYNPLKGVTGGKEDDLTHEQYMLRSINELSVGNGDYRPGYDVALMLPGWMRSTGANIEYKVAIACGIEVMHLEREGQSWRITSQTA